MADPQLSPCTNFFATLINLVINILSLFLPKSTVELMKNFTSTLPRDLRFFYKYLKVVLITLYHQKTNKTVIDLFDQNVRMWPNKPCFIFEGSEWSFKEVDMYSRRVTQVFKGRVAKGDVVALFMTSRAHYVPIWLGLGRLGVTTALLNTNQKNKPLVHSITTARPKVIIFSPDMAPGLTDVAADIDATIKLFCFGKTTCMFDYTDLQELITNSDPDYSPGPKINSSDTLLYIFTSGSSGLPKPAVMPHCRFMLVATLLQHVIEINPMDRVYCSLPLYHSSGGVLGVSSSLIVGATTVIRGKFSATGYFKDCVKYNCTVGQYIGETARYLLSTPPAVEDKIHSVRLLMGNGLQAEVWQQLYTRFNLPDIVEFYGSTEGNITLINTENLVGSCGFIPRYIPLLRRLIGVYLVKADENGVAIRNEKGLCIQCGINEPGLIVGIITTCIIAKKFYGYANQEEANNSKIICDVLDKGDKAFSSGDILVQDKSGNFYFKDRIGDTFRWKGENVATTEVEQVLRNFPKIIKCAVYGVQIPGTEGRAGMVSVVSDSLEADFMSFVRFLNDSLPKYAQPIFIRLIQNLEYTDTFKVKKYNLQKQGFDPNTIKDPIFYRTGSTFSPLTLQIYSDMIDGKISL